MKALRPFLIVAVATASSSCGRTADQQAIDAGGATLPRESLAATVYLHDLELAPSPVNNNDGVSLVPIALPGALSSASFGFFDDDAILRQLPHARLAEMVKSDFGFRFTADLDTDGNVETYRTGWYKRPGEPPSQFLAVFEDHALRDVVTAEAVEPLTISWRSGRPILYACNCPTRAPINYRNGSLEISWDAN